MFVLALILSWPMLVWALSPPQLRSINRLMMDPELPCRSKHMLESVLYKNYEQWAVRIGSNFKRHHDYKCKHIPFHEMAIYSRMGLLNAIRMYKPTKESAMFHLYAVHHIRGQLYKGMTTLSPIVNTSQKKLRSAGTIYHRATHHDGMLNNQPDPHIDNALRDSRILWDHISDTADPFTRRCITYKFDYDFNMIRSNKEVAALMECSEETVRSHILKYFVTQRLGVVLVRKTSSLNQ